jgi:hypothetical protein
MSNVFLAIGPLRRRTSGTILPARRPSWFRHARRARSASLVGKLTGRPGNTAGLVNYVIEAPDWLRPGGIHRAGWSIT